MMPKGSRQSLASLPTITFSRPTRTLSVAVTRLLSLQGSCLLNSLYEQVVLFWQLSGNAEMMGRESPEIGSIAYQYAMLFY